MISGCRCRNETLENHPYEDSQHSSRVSSLISSARRRPLRMVPETDSGTNSSPVSDVRPVGDRAVTRRRTSLPVVTHYWNRTRRDGTGLSPTPRRIHACRTWLYRTASWEPRVPPQTRARPVQGATTRHYSISKTFVGEAVRTTMRPTRGLVAIRVPSLLLVASRDLIPC